MHGPDHQATDGSARAAGDSTGVRIKSVLLNCKLMWTSRALKLKIHVIALSETAILKMYSFAHAMRRWTDHDIVSKRPTEHTNVEIDGGDVPGLEVPVRLNHLPSSICNHLPINQP